MYETELAIAIIFTNAMIILTAVLIGNRFNNLKEEIDTLKKNKPQDI